MSHLLSSRSSSTSSLSSAFSTSLTTPDTDSDVGSVGNNVSASSLTDRFILVTGGLGFIGSHTSVELLKAGYNVIIVDDLSNSFHSVLSKIRTLGEKHCAHYGRKLPTLHFHKLDYRSQAMRFLLESYSTLVPSFSEQAGESLKIESKISGVIHFAAFKSVSESIEKPFQYYRNNVCGLVDFVDLLGRHNIRKFVFSSSATVYGSKAAKGDRLREEDVVHHDTLYIDAFDNQTVVEPSVSGLTSPYGRSKYFCEAILADIAHADPSWRIVALRYFNPIGCDPSGLLGEDPKGIPTNLFPVITQVLTGSRSELDIFGTDWDTRDGTAVRDFIHVSDLARGHVAALSPDVDSPFRTFNLGTGNGTTVAEAVRSLEAASSQKIAINLAPRRVGDVGFCVAANDRAKKELGWTAKETIEQCAADLWNYVNQP
ncbi:UDP-glucose 4-epimerase [Fusarium heterosporum]|uniref:UDP-glucose 4-epimerase n=1 Tax=Fusarium heterosporum TaxID=42747 RepID=A0A8H5T5G8_FUSHE|nr:UDP-glucose 4-epimerase [Fusarium heterosporum]